MCTQLKPHRDPALLLIIADNSTIPDLVSHNEILYVQAILDALPDGRIIRCLDPSLSGNVSCREYETNVTELIL